MKKNKGRPWPCNARFLNSIRFNLISQAGDHGNQARPTLDSVAMETARLKLYGTEAGPSLGDLPLVVVAEKSTRESEFTTSAVLFGIGVGENQLEKILKAYNLREMAQKVSSHCEWLRNISSNDKIWNDKVILRGFE